MSVQNDRAEEIAHRYTELLNREEFDDLADLFADDARIWICGDTFTKESFRELAKGVFTTMYAQGPFMEPLNCFSCGERAVIEVITTGTTMSGNPYRNRYCLVFEMDGDKIVAMNEYLDSAVARAAHGRFSPTE